MASLPSLNVSGLPRATAEEAAATSSPARGKEMRANLLNKLRAPPLVHAWDFWHDRQNRQTTESSADQTSTSAAAAPEKGNKYEERLVHLASMTDIRSFWSVFNNFDILALPLRDSVHLFHRGVKPLWEDPRNVAGGCWTFRVPKHQAAEFWKQICLLAVGEQLQNAVASDRVTFRDDICGVSCSVRFTSVLVSIWNRDAKHERGVEEILKTVREGVQSDIRPKDGSYYYKAHSEHAAFGTKAGHGKSGDGDQYKSGS